MAAEEFVVVVETLIPRKAMYRARELATRCCCETQVRHLPFKAEPGLDLWQVLAPKGKAEYELPQLAEELLQLGYGIEQHHERWFDTSCAPDPHYDDGNKRPNYSF
jgi:hypothetical protein